MFLAGDRGRVFGGGFWAGGRCFLWLIWRFCSSGGRSSEICCEAGLGLSEWISRMNFLWCLSFMSVKGKMSNVNGCILRIVMWSDFFRLLLFLDGGRQGKVTGVKVEMEMVVGVVARMVWPNLGVLLEVVVLV